MSLVVPSSLIERAKSPLLEGLKRPRFHSRTDDSKTELPLKALTDEVIAELSALAAADENTSLVKTLKVIADARKGNADVASPRIDAFADIMKSYLLQDMKRGWIFTKGRDDNLYPELVTSINYDAADPRNRIPASVTLNTVSYGMSKDNSKKPTGINRNSYRFFAGDIRHKRVSECFLEANIFKETDELLADYDASIKRFHEVVRPEFAEQFLFTGTSIGRSGWGISSPEDGINKKVIHDLHEKEFGDYSRLNGSCLFEDGTEDENDLSAMGEIPEHPVIQIFDLSTHESYFVHENTLTPYQYNPGLKDKMVLPAIHKDLLDILTTDLDEFSADIIEGKSAGNIILCQGIAGVGKTLTAEIYAEIIKRPLYSIRSGTLGTNSSKIEENLREIFKKARRWNCVLLLDEADVFVCKRGDNIEQNAIVAEFLRTLEYFEGLMFMTTNRPDDIDDAVISRCAAIIKYKAPDRNDAKQIWQVMAKQFETEINPALQENLLDMFPNIAPRDIKLVLRLALRMAKKHESPLTADIFRQCAMFRSVEIASLDKTIKD